MEPEPIESLKTLIFPDFQIKNRKDPSQTWFIEIIGFWTPEYLSNKLRKLKDARIGNIILCIDATKNCTGSDLPAGARIVRYKKKIDPAEVLGMANKK